MAFEVVYGARSVIPSGTARLSAQGHGSFHQDDLTAVKITKTATVLVDRETQEIAIRAPHGDEACNRVITKKERTRGTISLKQAIATLQKSCKDVCGNYAVTVRDGMIILSLAPKPPTADELEAEEVGTMAINPMRMGASDGKPAPTPRFRHRKAIAT